MASVRVHVHGSWRAPTNGGGKARPIHHYVVRLRRER